MEWELPEAPYTNMILRGDGFTISYQPTNPERGEPETALHIYKEDKFYILLGDWRRNYEEAWDGTIEAAKKVYNENIEFRSPISSDVELIDLDDCSSEEALDFLKYQLQASRVGVMKFLELLNCEKRS